MSQKDWLITYDLSQRRESSAVCSVLDLLAAITSSDCGNLYRMDPATCDLRLISARPVLEDGRIPRITQPCPPVEESTVFRPGDPGFDKFPETTIFPVHHLLAVPIRVQNQLAGLLVLTRDSGNPYGPADIQSARKAGAALYELLTLRRENLLLEKRLAERKLMERAKGLLQIHYGWSEEDAYYHLRRTSRQQRTPMAVIAQRVIDVVAANEVA